jgi:hypothetical protein
MIVDFNGADRATVNTVGCLLVRTGAATAKAAMATTAVAATSDSGGAALQWKLLGHVDNAGGIDVYIAPATVRRSGDKARMLDLFDFKTRQMFEGKAYRSARNEYEFDCARPRQRMVGTMGFSGQMATGSVVASSEGNGPWEAVGSSGPAFEHWQVACKR